ncbi:MAG: hypothetical protein AB2A00_39435 [Myxococcota bacterium]
MDLYRNDYVALELEEARGLVRFTRLEKKLKGTEELDPAFAPLEKVIQSVDRSRYVLLVDLRRGPLRNDPEFEQAMERYRVGLSTGFRRVAVLVRSAVGELQVQRQARQNGGSAKIFHDEAEALTFLGAAQVARAG